MYKMNQNQTQIEREDHKVRQLEVLRDLREAPILYEKRSCTDVCCLAIGLIFSFIIFILAGALYNYSNYYHANFPSDSEGRLCGNDNLTEAYPYVYFVNPPDMSRRVCVQGCPTPTSTQLDCIPTEQVGCSFTNTSGFEVINYPNYQQQTRSGYFCYPSDTNMRDTLLQNSNLSTRDQIYNSLDTIKLSFFVSLGFCVLYLLLVQFFASYANYGTVILGSLMIIACIVCILTYNTNENTFKILQVIVLAGALIVILITAWRSFSSWQVHLIFLNYATKMVKDKPLTLLYIPFFLICLFGFVVIIILQFISFWTSGTLKFDGQTQLFYQLSGGAPIALTVLLAIQTLWGFCFIKAAFNFCVSSQTVQWFYRKQQGLFYSFKLMLCKHIGSVIASSFMTAFIAWMDFIFDTLKPHKSSAQSRYNNCYYKFCQKFIGVFDLARQDALAYISLTANPYCNSSRYCEYLCGRSCITEYSQSISRIYRISAHCLLIGIMIIFSLYVKGTISINALLIIGLIAMFISTLFISFHADIAQAIQIVFLADEQFLKRRKTSDGDDIQNDQHQLEGLQIAHQELVQPIKQLRHKQRMKNRKQ